MVHETLVLYSYSFIEDIQQFAFVSKNQFQCAKVENFPKLMNLCFLHRDDIECTVHGNQKFRTSMVPTETSTMSYLEVGKSYLVLIYETIQAIFT